MNEQENRFREWVTEEYQQRGWSMRELARRADMSIAGVSQVLGGQAGVSWEFCAAMARAFGMPEVEVFRKAGLLSQLNDDATEAAEIVASLPPAKQTIALYMLRGLLAYGKEPPPPEIAPVEPAPVPSEASPSDTDTLDQLMRNGDVLELLYQILRFIMTERPELFDDAWGVYQDLVEAQSTPRSQPSQ